MNAPFNRAILPTKNYVVDELNEILIYIPRNRDRIFEL